MISTLQLGLTLDVFEVNELHPREEDPMTLTLFPASWPRTAPTPESADPEETLVCFSAGWVAELGSLPLTGGAGSTVGSGVHKRAMFETVHSWGQSGGLSLPNSKA